MLRLHPPREGARIAVDIALSEAGRRDALKHKEPSYPQFRAWIGEDDPGFEDIAPYVTRFTAEYDDEGPDLPVLTLNTTFTVEVIHQKPSTPIGEQNSYWRRPRAVVRWSPTPLPLHAFEGLNTIISVGKAQWDAATKSLEGLTKEIESLVKKWGGWFSAWVAALREETSGWDFWEAKMVENSLRSLERVLLSPDEMQSRGDGGSAVEAATDELIDVVMAARRDIRKRKEQATRDAGEIAEAEAWVAKHGSRRLRMAQSAGLLSSSMAVYRSERLDEERPGWKLLSKDVMEQFKKVLNPSEEALDALLDAREQWPDTELRFLQEKNQPGELWLTDKFHGRAVGIPVNNYAANRFLFDEEHDDEDKAF